MKQNIRLSMFALCLLVFASAKQTFALEHNRYGLQEPDADTAEKMAARVNAYRTEAGLPAFTTNDALANAAQKVANHMAATEFISHYDADGANPSQRALQAGYADHVTEIIYGGFGGAETAWAYWTENDLHNDLILSEDYHEFGVGMANGTDSGRTYWAIMLGTGIPPKEPTVTVAPGTVTKLPATAVTAEPSPSPTASQTPPEPHTDETSIALTALENTGPDNGPDAAANPDNIAAPPPAEPANPDADDSPWLIVAAALTILAGIIFFYFPRARWARSSS